MLLCVQRCTRMMRGNVHHISVISACVQKTTSKTLVLKLLVSRGALDMRVRSASTRHASCCGRSPSQATDVASDLKILHIRRSSMLSGIAHSSSNLMHRSCVILMLNTRHRTQLILHALCSVHACSSTCLHLASRAPDYSASEMSSST